MNGLRASAWLRLGLLAVLLLGVAVVVVVYGVPSLEQVRSTVADAGAWAPVLFVVLFVLATLAVLPVTVFSLAAGVLFGPAAGTGLVWLGAMCGALSCFGLGRLLSGPALARLTGSGRAGPTLLRLERYLSRRGLLAVLWVRLVPVVPFGPSSYLAGATALGVREFTLGTGLGIVPSIVVYTALGGNVSDPTSPAFLLSVVALLGLLGVTGLLARRQSRVGGAEW